MDSNDVEEIVVEELEPDEDEEEDETTSTRNYPCPTCGTMFSELSVCEKHARFCSVTEDEPGANWSDERIFLLIDCMQSRYKKYVQMSPKQRKQHWKWAGQIVGATSEETRIRWNSLTNSYNRVRFAIAQGRQRGSVWRFYSKMDQILGDGAVNPEFVLSSMPLQVKGDGSVQPHTGMVLSTEGDGDGGNNAKILDLMEKRFSEFIELAGKKRKAFWCDVENKLNIPAEEARVRWNMLVGSFKRAKLNRTQHKNRYGREPRGKWRFYDQMERTIGHRLNATMPLVVLSSRQPPPASGFPLATGANLLTAGKPLPNIAPAPPRPVGGATPATKAAGQSGKVPAPAAATEPQSGTPQQQQADAETYATKRKALFVEDYLRAKARREEQRLQLEERRIKVLERLVDVMEARGNS